MVEKINEIINSLQKETALRQEDKFNIVVRFIDSKSAVPLFVGYNPENRARYLFIHVKEKFNSMTIKKLPTWNGMNITQTFTSIPLSGYKDEHFLVLTHQDEYDHDIFEAVIESICNDLLNLNEYKYMLYKLQRNLERWKSFFSNHGREGLSLEAQQGLFGELLILRELLENDLGNFSVLDNWIGPEKDPNDFRKFGVALEIKTITSKKHYKVYINNEQQLDDSGLNNLFLLAVILRKIDSGETLKELIDSVRKVLINDQYYLRIFEEKLFLVGYLDNQSHLYTIGYVFQELLSFEVKEGFPRILSGELHNGVGDLKYSIFLAACDKYKVGFKEILNRFKSIEEN